ncbi:alpha-glucosidase domain-containing protein [Hymenobacter sp. AT01-02]|uniref:alpha-glucosidase domain-containing protein n=1 Tax=Hymenobacter sp. AT01-02 TaxID=1571877 RepID=UPI00191C03C9|nr:alpha-glucosidase domain-containing protein [Hymenobacter sp. AT01-02]
MRRRFPIDTCIIMGGLLTFASTATVQAQQARVEKLSDGMLVHLPPGSTHQARTIRLQVVGEHILHVQASPLDTVSTVKSLMAVEHKPTSTKWQYKSKKDQASISTPTLTATVALPTGAITFTNAQGRCCCANLVLAAKPSGSPWPTGSLFTKSRNSSSRPPTRHCTAWGSTRTG